VRGVSGVHLDGFIADMMRFSDHFGRFARPSPWVTSLFNLPLVFRPLHIENPLHDHIMHICKGIDPEPRFRRRPSSPLRQRFSPPLQKPRPHLRHTYTPLSPNARIPQIPFHPLLPPPHNKQTFPVQPQINSRTGSEDRSSSAFPNQGYSCHETGGGLSFAGRERLTVRPEEECGRSNGDIGECRDIGATTE
jgi:hypothetical protein